MYAIAKTLSQASFRPTVHITRDGKATLCGREVDYTVRSTATSWQTKFCQKCLGHNHKEAPHA